MTLGYRILVGRQISIRLRSRIEYSYFIEMLGKPRTTKKIIYNKKEFESIYYVCEYLDYRNDDWAFWIRIVLNKNNKAVKITYHGYD